MNTPPEPTRLRLDIAYDGTGFSGWSKQPGLRTVQGELEAGLATVFQRRGDPPTLTVAGRTDAGVHALGQVAHLDLTTAQLLGLGDPRRGKRTPAPDSSRKAGSPSTGSPDIGSPEASAATLARRLNGIAGLDSDLYVKAASIAPAGFDARFSAVWRRYEYRIADTRAERNPLHRRNTLWYPADLDLDRMNDAGRLLTGLHDFAAYCKPRDGATTIRTLQELRWERDAAGVLVARVKADAFCHSMVRALVGASVSVGAGRLPPQRVAEILERGERTSEFKVLPAKGLTLVEVGYPDDAELALRAEQTRARRQPPLTGMPLVD